MPMKPLFVIVFIFIAGSIISCTQPDGQKELTSQMSKIDSCQNNIQHTYEVFIPAVEKSDAQLPLLVVIDPHGSGKYALAQFKEAASKYSTLMISSNLVKNNYAGYIHALEELVQDVKNKYPIGNTIYLAGFSGGARMAIAYAQNHRVNGVIACGALAQPEQIKAVNCPVYAITGMDDFNFIEAARFVLDPDKIPANLLIEITHVSHAWPTKEVLTNAFGYLDLSSSTPKIGLHTKSLTKEYVQQQKNQIDSLISTAEILQATLLSRKMSLVPEFEKRGDFKPAYLKLLNDPVFSVQKEELSKSLQFELKVRDAYYNAFQQKDTLWWGKEINSLQSKINSEKNLFTLMAYQRIKGFLGIMCYSLSNRYVSNKDLINLEKILSVYHTLEPENPDMFYFSALDAQWRGNATLAASNLVKAKEAGYSDLEKVKQQFPPALVTVFRHTEH